MKHTVESQVTPELLYKSDVTEEDIFREIACQMVRDMDFEHLKTLMDFSILDPNSDEGKLILNDEKHPFHWEYVRLKQREVLLFKAVCS